METYKKQVNLLLSVLEVALEDERFALKAGTAINLFYRNLPRYFVDIDLCYLPLEDRATSMENIHAILRKISAEIRKLPRLTATSSRPLDGRGEAKLQVEDHEVRIKIEPNYILRGYLFPTKDMLINKRASEEFNVDIYAKCLSFEDVYGGKLCAALDRQHPREMLIAEITKSLNDNDRVFLRSFVRNFPNWNLVSNIKIREFPAVRWKLLNQQKMSEMKRIKYIKTVDKLLA